MIPLAAAVAAGCAVITILDPLVPTANALLRKVVQESLDYEAIKMISSDGAETSRCLYSMFFGVAVLQNLEVKDEAAKSLREANPTIRILEPSSGPAAVFVDRSTSDLKAVAAHIRASFVQNVRKNRTRCPHVCFVDEFLIDELKNLLWDSREIALPVSSTDKDYETSEKLRKHLEKVFPASLSQCRDHSLPWAISLSNTE
jgi:hypothetical protein